MLTCFVGNSMVRHTSFLVCICFIQALHAIPVLPLLGGQVTSAEFSFCSEGLRLLSAVTTCGPDRILFQNLPPALSFQTLPMSVSLSWPPLPCSVPQRLRLGQPTHVLRWHRSVNTNSNGQEKDFWRPQMSHKKAPMPCPFSVSAINVCWSCRTPHLYESWPCLALKRLISDDATSRTPNSYRFSKCIMIKCLHWNVLSLWNFKESVWKDLRSKAVLWQSSD